MNFKAILASAAVATCCLFNPSAAEAATQTCWRVPSGGQVVSGFRCNVSSRYNANGHLVHDINTLDGVRFSVILWTSGGNADDAEVFIDGERFTTAWYYDGDGDVRINLGRHGEFVF